MTHATEPDSIHVSTPQATVSFKRIVVGLDYDESETNVLQMASRISAAFGSKVFVVHAFLPPPPTRRVEVIPDDFLDRSLSEAERRLRPGTVGISPLIDRKKWDFSVSVDVPEDLIVKTAREQQADLILMGSHGRRGLSNLLLGSTAELVLSRAGCPVMILGPEYESQKSTWSTVLFATDLEKTGIRAAEYAAALAAEHQGSLLLLHVKGEKAPSEDQMREWTEDHVRETLCRLLSPSVLESCRYEAIVAYGDPAEEILAAADMKRADLIVLGAGDHQVMADHQPWRTLAHVIASARCPVLNIPATGK